MAGIISKKQYGAVVLSECLNCVALVRRGDVWNFPYAMPPEGLNEPAAAIAIVRDLVGLDITDKFKIMDFVEAEAYPLTRQAARLFVAVNVPEDDLVAGEGVDEAVWRPLDEFMRRGEDAVLNAALPHLSFLPGLRRYVERHPELQTDAVPEVLKSGLTYDPNTWVGITPKEHLAEWCHNNELPTVSYLHSMKVKEKYLGTCVLSSVGVQVTPIELFWTAEIAEQTAALFAIVYLEGGFSGFSQFCRVVPVGFNPEQKPESIVPVNGNLPEEERVRIIRATMLQEVDAQKAHLLTQLQVLDKQREILEEGGDAAMDLITRHYAFRRPSARLGRGRGGYLITGGRGRGPYGSGRPRAGPPSKRFKLQEADGTDSEAPSPGPDQGKTPVQILKEHCDMQRWNQPTYEFTDETVGSKPQFKCFVSIKDANVVRLESSVEPNHRSAKSAAAKLALQALQLP